MGDIGNYFMVAAAARAEGENIFKITSNQSTYCDSAICYYLNSTTFMSRSFDCLSMDDN